jgi:hypothetical protein
MYINYLFLVFPLINDLLIALSNSLEHPVHFAGVEEPVGRLGTGQFEGLYVVFEGGLRVPFEVRRWNEVRLVKR